MPFVLVGNVPYYITTPILFHALEPPRAERAVYLVQREVAERIGGAPGADEYGALSVNVQAVANAELLFSVPPGAFKPPPKVESAVVRIDAARRSGGRTGKRGAVPALRAGRVRLRRKQMRRVVRTVAERRAADAEAVLAAAGIDPTRARRRSAPSSSMRWGERCGCGGRGSHGERVVQIR